MKSYIQKIINVRNQEDKDVLIAQLSEVGFEGFEEERTTLKAFIPAEHFNSPDFEWLMNEKGFSFSTEIIEQQNWNALWEAGFDPVIIDQFCAVRADFHQPVAGVKYQIIITPKMSFGTGHHATTFMMISCMQDIDFTNKRVFDFGTGTGVLAILAEKLGAANIQAIDNDDWSIENAKENILSNDCATITVEKKEQIDGGLTYDIILANINKHVILSHMHSISKATAANGMVLFSGLLADDEQEINVSATGAGLSFIKKIEKHNWICLIYVNKS